MMYQGRDRVRQVDALDLEAEDIYASAMSSDDAEALVDFWVEKMGDDLPEWFDDYDRQMLENLVRERM